MNLKEKISEIFKGETDPNKLGELAGILNEVDSLNATIAKQRDDNTKLANAYVNAISGVVDKSKILDPSTMKAGDVVIALPSSGVHSNGFSLVRKVFDVENSDIKSSREELGGKSIGETLLTPTKIYVKPVLALLEQVKVKGISHITGGGFYENIPRSIPDGLGAVIERNAVRVLPIFDLIAKEGNISERDMFNTFNMGVGMSIVVAREDAEKAVKILKANGEDAYVIGKIENSEDKITIC